ncbi:hypothetical protein Pint_20374 [Pistacia integerrima]|uniref:Uncharacterized protein n=1 Tax=Pistacia integerrima TaxID=434235 RepID=A0ACC0XB99_9ROSI|nr:hypothetical protein Pint_20374 [Pistacia integerrima]
MSITQMMEWWYQSAEKRISAPTYKRCPVTLMASNVEQIRRLFHDV